jgi:PAB-dependent poly(A)-specific ribonuclease subunit 2
MGIARISVLRGNGPKQGVPFIDDHIHLGEPIVDFLTAFSGIKCNVVVYLTQYPFISRIFPVGDLDPHLSRHTLIPLKLAYKKLRLLVDRGCIFIGHGLAADFRFISKAI